MEINKEAILSKLKIVKGNGGKRYFLLSRFSSYLSEARMKDNFSEISYFAVARLLKSFDDSRLDILWANCIEGLDFESDRIKSLAIFSSRFWQKQKMNPPRKEPKTIKLF